MSKNGVGFVQIPRDLTAIKSRVAFNLSRRQLICFGTAAAIGVPTYLLTRGALGNSTAVIAMIVLMLPLFFLAMYEKDGMPAEKILRNYVRTKIYWRGVRLYKTENLYKYLERGGNIIAEKNKSGAKK